MADLHRELVRQGFRAVVLSGDRAQAERNLALSALREGEAQVLVATNVAARGLDLPEVDLVIHADLPLNTEALTHRSGRTGRAGRKGTSVLIANLAERRKAERLLAGARVTYTWTVAPGAAEIASEGEKRLEAALTAAEENREASVYVLAVAERLGKHIKKDALIHLLLERELANVPKGEKLKPVDLKVVARDNFRPTGPPPDREEFARDAVRFRINLGADSRAEPGWLLPLICRRGGVTRREIGAIRVVSAGFSEFESRGTPPPTSPWRLRRPIRALPMSASSACRDSRAPRHRPTPAAVPTTIALVPIRRASSTPTSRQVARHSPPTSARRSRAVPRTQVTFAGPSPRTSRRDRRTGTRPGKARRTQATSPSVKSPSPRSFLGSRIATS